MKTYTFHIHGMYCSACALTIENELAELPKVQKAKASFKRHYAEIIGDFGDSAAELVAADLNKVLEKHGYRLSAEKQTPAKNWGDFKVAIPLAIGFMALFVIIQKAGIVNLISA